MPSDDKVLGAAWKRKNRNQDYGQREVNDADCGVDEIPFQWKGIERIFYNDPVIKGISRFLEKTGKRV